MTFLDRVKTVIFWFYNPRSFLARDSNGRVIPDRKRRKASKELQVKIDSGEIKIGDKPRCLKRRVKGQISVSKLES